jgi:adenylate kinase family enzyme
LKRRQIDTPAIIRRRLVEYRERTQPIFDIVEGNGYRVGRIDGSRAPYQVVTEIVRRIAR